LGSGELTDDDVLLVGPGCRSAAAEYADAIRDWIAGGGQVLALGLEADEANSFLPVSIRTEAAEHIADWFEPFGADSLLAGVAPADIHNAVPRQIPLLRGETAIGNGVLGELANHHVIFCQMTPRGLDLAAGDIVELQRAIAKQHNVKRTWRRNSYAITRLLANMGVAGPTPLLERFSAPVNADQRPEGASPGSTETQGRWLEGFYMPWDTPEEWDDPYRFFRW
jgi:hypothetical protein